MLTLPTVPFMGTLVPNCFVLILATYSTTGFLIFVCVLICCFEDPLKIGFYYGFIFLFLINIKANKSLIYKWTQNVNVRIKRYTYCIVLWNYYSSIFFHGVSDYKEHVHCLMSLILESIFVALKVHVILCSWCIWQNVVNE